ncbi:MAG TPA: TetR/AcrR family transcriptional regulator [Candidatus Binataceae bacterium]
MPDSGHRAAAALALPSRRERKKERTRGEIYIAAINLFLKRGFDTVTIEDICRAADVARATFFLHFPAKEALLAEYWNRSNDELAALIRAHRGSSTSALRASFKMLAARAVRHPDLVRLMVREVITQPPVRSEHDQRAKDLVLMLAAVIRRGQAAGEFRRRIEPTLAALTACAGFFALIYEWVRRGGKLDIEAAIAASLDVILIGLNEKKPKRASGRSLERRRAADGT